MCNKLFRGKVIFVDKWNTNIYFTFINYNHNVSYGNNKITIIIKLNSINLLLCMATAKQDQLQSDTKIAVNNYATIHRWHMR